MRVRVEQLPQLLRRAPLAPVFLLAGDEPLQMTECADQVRAAARAAGVEERVVLEVERGFDWSALAEASASLSLFAARRLIEVRLGSEKPGAQGERALLRYLERPPPEDILLITSAKLEARVLKAAWVQRVEASGAVVLVWPVERNQLPGWINRRMAVRGLRASAEVAEFLADRGEGNLLAAAQDVELLALLFQTGEVNADAVMQTVSDSARFNAFELMPSAMSGDAARAVRILRGLRDEGVEPVFVSWVVTRDLRGLCALALARGRGEGLEPVYLRYNIRDKRREPYERALRSEDRVKFQRLLRAALRIDRSCKGLAPGDPWDEITWLCLRLAGAVTVPQEPMRRVS